MLDSEKSLLKILTTRLSALKKISVNASFKTRLMVANGCFLSVVSYMISVWGGTEAYLIKAVQVMQNKAARCITKKCWYTPTRTLLTQCNWLSIKQLTFYHTVLQVWKVRSAGVPSYINSKFQAAVTRSAEEGTLRVPIVERDLSSKSFLVRSAGMWNRVPPDIRNSQNLETFKRKLKGWTRENVEIE